MLDRLLYSFCALLLLICAAGAGYVATSYPVGSEARVTIMGASAKELPAGVTFHQPGCRAPGPIPQPPKGSPPNSTYFAAGYSIPARYQGNPAGWMKIKFMEPDEVNRVCAGGVPVCGQVFYACWHQEDNQDVLIMPNPCKEKGAPNDVGYAGTLCHEKAHFMGWPATHGD